MNVLVACEESQTVCKAFRDRGHRAFSCDIQDCSGGHPEWHIKGDVLPLLNGDITFTTVDTHTHTQSGQWDLLIAHPPCTYLTNGGAVRMFVQTGVIDPNRYALAMEGKEFFMKCLKAKCEHIAVENPVPMSVVGLPEYDQIIEPYWFGDPYSKRTCLWLKNLPKLKPTNMLTEWQVLINGGGGRLEREHYKDKQFANTAKARSKTFKGVAEAMATQWTDTYQVQMQMEL